MVFYDGNQLHNHQVEDDPTGGKMADAELHKLHNVASFHLGDIVTSLQKGSLVSGGQEAIIYSTLMGGIGMHTSCSVVLKLSGMTHTQGCFCHLRPRGTSTCLSTWKCT